MKRFFTSLFLLATLAAPALLAQNQLNTPDPKAIAATPRDTYRSLLSRFEAGQKLSPDEVVTVYYGAAAQPGFNPNVTYAALDAAYNAGDMAKAHNLAAEALRKDPTNLYLLFKAFGSAAASSDPTVKSLAPKYQTRLNGICDAIFSSGLGVADSSPYLVTRTSDAQEFIVKFLQPTAIKGTSKLADLDAVKLALDGIPDDVIIYFKQYK